MKNNNLYIEIHTLKNIPTSHLNTDDSGALKTCTFAATERARISSQSIKHAWRTSEMFSEFSKELDEDEYSYRTRELKKLVFERLKAEYAFEDESVENKISDAVVSKLVGNEKGVMCFISSCDVSFISSLVMEQLNGLSEEAKESLAKDPKKIDIKNIGKKMKEYYKENGKRIPALINLFGRMSTSDAIESVDSSVSVSHAISTHETTQELDYFSAVDDIAMLENSGSGHLAETEFNSACYYHYVNFDVNQFIENLEKNVTSDEYRKNAIEKIVKTLIETICMITPETKKTSFAAATLPEAVYVVIKKRKIPCQLANAFADPVENKAGMVRESVERLAKEADLISGAYDLGEIDRIWFAPRYDISPEAATVAKTLNELIEKVSDYIEC